MKTLSLLPLLLCMTFFADKLGSQQGPPSAPPPAAPGAEPIYTRPVRPHAPADFGEGQKETTTPQRHFDAARARRDAEELAALANKIPAQVDKVSSQVLPKDLTQQLKQIEKLAKRLRGEISQ